MAGTVFARPSLPDLIARVCANIEAALPGIDPQLARSITVGVGTVLAQELANEYAYLDNLAQWFFVTTTSGIYLDLKGQPVGVPREAGAFAAGPVIFTGVPESVIPAAAVLQTADESQSYALSSSVTIGSGGTSPAGTVTALSVGAEANQGAGTILTLAVASPGVVPQATVGTAAIAGGLDIESDADYRIRVLARLQQPPQGGAARDYVAWAKLVPGVTRVWVYPLNRGAGTVDFAFVLDGRAPGSILPTGTDITNVTASINANRPVAASSQAVTLTGNAIAVTIGTLTAAEGYTKAQALANATTSLAAVFAVATPGGASYGDGIAQGSTGGTILLETIYDAITESAGVAGFDLTAPTADVVSGTDTLSTLGTVTAP